MCGLVGIMSNEPVAQDIYDSLITLQHRGQDAAGIATYNGKIHIKKGGGLVRDIFHSSNMQLLQGNVGIGHTRYSTVGGLAVEDAHPFMISAPYGIVMAHNGNLVNFHSLKKELMEDKRHINSENDIETILHLFALGLEKQKLNSKLKPENVFEAVKNVHDRAVGAYSVVGYIAGQGLVAFRDPNGIRPLVFGSRTGSTQKEYMFASENVALDLLGFELEDIVQPGEVVFIDNDRNVHRKQVTPGEHHPCIFEYIYFARPDSLLDNISVYKSRLRLGDSLAEKIRNEIDLSEIDVVVPVPDSSRTAALQIAQELGIRYREGLIKNRYIGRTFIMPGQKKRKRSIRHKLNAMALELKGKNVLLVDDSIVRGNTSRKIIEMVREAGAKKVFFASYSSPIISPDLYGIDIPSYRELIASDMSNDEICKAIGADKLFYQEYDSMVESVRGKKFPDQKFHAACFDGKYIVGDITKELLEQHDTTRSCEKREALETDNQLNLL